MRSASALFVVGRIGGYARAVRRVGIDLNLRTNMWGRKSLELALDLGLALVVFPNGWSWMFFYPIGSPVRNETLSGRRVKFVPCVP